MSYKEDTDMQFTEWEAMSNTVHRKIKFKQIGNDLLKLETANKYAFIRVLCLYWQERLFIL